MASTRGRQVVLPLVNKSGGGVVAGDVVVNDASNDGAFTTTTSASETSKWIGIAQETIAANATGRVLLAGYASLVNVNASVTRGHFAFTHTVAKQASGSASRAAGAFGQFLTGGTSPTATLWGFPDSSSAGGGAPSTAQYVVGAADGTLSAEIVVTAPAASGAIPVVKYKSADESVADNTLQDDNHMVFAVGANEVWVGCVYLYATNAAATGDLKYQFTAPAGATIRYGGAGVGTAATSIPATANFQSHTSAAITLGVISTAAIENFAVLAFYVANGGNAGNVTLQWAQNTTDGSNPTIIKAGSYLSAYRVA